MNIALEPRIQSRPAIRLAISDLPAVEQDHVRISLRIISPRLPVPCVVVQQMQADIVLKPCAAEPSELCLVSEFGERHIDRPLRLVPLSEALSEMIDVMLREERGPGKSPTPQESTLVELLQSAPQAQASRIELQSGVVFDLDRRHHTLRFLSAQDIERVRSNDRIATRTPSVAPSASQKATPEELAASIQAEQLFWLLASGNAVPQQLQRWLEDVDAVLSLDSWPNLSRQPDALAWIQVLVALAGRSMSIRETLKCASDAGIAPERARFGVALLCMFRHARLTQATQREAVESAPPARSTHAPISTAQSGLLSRLRSKLRSLLS